jgi:DNA-directed RNA polymerase subunit beta
VHSIALRRISPIETPEGPNSAYLALGIYAQINPFGFIETPYRVTQRQGPNECNNLSADVERSSSSLRPTLNSSRMAASPPSA